MTSLRFRLTASLLGATISVGLVATALVYWQALDDSRSDLDNQMLQIARFASAGTPAASLPAEALSVDDEPREQISVTVRDASGQLRFSSGPAPPMPVAQAPGFHNLSIDGVGYRTYASSSGPLRIVVAQPQAAQQDDAREAALSAAAPLATLLPTLGLIIGWVVRRQMAPVAELAHDVATRAALSLEPLPDYQVPTEIRPLLREIDRLLLRQRAAMEREHQFILDAAHAIRTPLTALQLQSDIVDGSADPAERARRLTQLKAGIRRTSHLSNQLLALARDAAQEQASHGVSRLDQSLAEVYRLYLPIAEDRQVALRLDAGVGPAVPGNGRQHALIFGNLIDNALRYTRPGGTVRIVATAGEDQARVRIEDEGPGIAEAELPKVLDRFYRAAGDDTEGSGLGLSVVQATVTLLGGTLQLSNKPDRRGLIATVSLRLAA